jgi:hypothetical protein
MTSVMSVKAPISHLDPYSSQALIEPWPIYAELQDAGPAVWLSKYEMFALTRYETWRPICLYRSWRMKLDLPRKVENECLYGLTRCSTVLGQRMIARVRHGLFLKK